MSTLFTCLLKCLWIICGYARICMRDFNRNFAMSHPTWWWCILSAYIRMFYMHHNLTALYAVAGASHSADCVFVCVASLSISKVSPAWIRRSTTMNTRTTLFLVHHRLLYGYERKRERDSFIRFVTSSSKLLLLLNKSTTNHTSSQEHCFCFIETFWLSQGFTLKLSLFFSPPPAVSVSLCKWLK